MLPKDTTPKISIPKWSNNTNPFNQGNISSWPQNIQHGKGGARPRTEVNKSNGKHKLNRVNSGISKTANPGPTGNNLGNLGVSSLPQHNNQKANFAYQCGRASDPNRSLSGNKTSFLNNKCLVIKGIGKHLDENQIKRKINSIAQRDIGFLFDPVILSKTTQTNRTIVFELNEDDYATLSNPDIWDSTVQVAEFAGTRWWRKNNSKYTPRQKSKSVRDSFN